MEEVDTFNKMKRKQYNIEKRSKESLSMQSPCSDNKSEDFVTPTDHIDVQSNENSVLFIGDHENQLSEGGEIDLPQYKKNCKKNPGHPEFIPIESFSLEHLPKDRQDSDLFDYIKAIADLTVKLSVQMTTPDRPEFWPNTKIPYFLSDIRGKTTLRTGTGRVYKVDTYTDEDKHWKYGCTPCPCNKCKASDQPRKVWWEIKVHTAAHVVVDDFEASHTTLRLFYDREDSVEIILKDKVCVDIVNIIEDWCVLSCVTCDELLGSKLEKMKKNVDDVFSKVYNKYSKSYDTDNFNFIVSHPHGCFKQVSVGQSKDLVQIGNDEDAVKLTYTTCTCPGSSGAHVYFVGNNWWYGRVHSGSLSGLNYSSVF